MISNTIIAGLNRYLQCDQERAQGLKKIDQKVIAITLRESDLTIAIKINEFLFEELNETEVKPDVEIVASLKVLPDYFIGIDQNQLVKNGDIEIIGDSHVASTFHNVLREIEIDWEDLLSKYTGDVAANQIGKGVRRTQSFIRRLRNNLRLDMRDFLQDEIQVSATNIEVDDFIKQVDIVTSQLDKLEERVNQLTTRK